MAAVSYDNGLYTPDTWDSLATAAVEEQTTEDPVESTAAWAADATSTAADEEEPAPTTSTTPAAIATTSSSSSSAAPASTVDAGPPPSTYTISPAAVVVSASSSSISPTSFLSPSTSASSSSSAPLASASLNALSATDEISPTSSFVSMKQWLIPVIVVAPILIGILVLGCLYGKCWGRRRQRAQEQEMGGDGGGWFGGAGSLGRRRRDHGGEEGGFVGGKYAEDDAECDDFDEKAAYAGTGPPPQRSWSTMLRSGLGRGLSHASSIRPPRRQKVPFLAVSRPSMVDEPFLPPSQSQSHYDQAFRAVPNSRPAQAGGWNYGGRPQPTMSQPTNAGLTSGWGVGNYRAKSTSSRNSSVKSRLSARLFGNRNMEEPPSPSCYSHTDGAYAGLEGEEDDPEMKEEELNEILAESRTGDSHLARRYMGGETHLADVCPSNARQPPAREQEQLAKDRYFARHPTAPASHQRDLSYDHLVEQMGIDLPSPPRQSHVSPTKTSTGSALLRPAMSGTPAPSKLLFSYDSPPVHSTYQAPSYQPQLVSPERAPGSPRGPLPRPPQPQQPVFGNPPPPPRQQESQFNNSRPLYPSAQPGIFFTTTTQPPLGGPPMRQSMPQSSSNYLLSGARGVAYGAGGEQAGMSGQQQQQPQGAPKQRPISPTKEGGAKLRKANPNAPLHYPTILADRPHLPSHDPFASAPPPAQPSAPEQQPQQTFNPIFPDSAPLPPLQHPSRVRNAIHNLEAASAGSPPPSPTKPASPYRPMSASYPSSSALAQSTSTPSPQRVIRSHTTYQRPIKSESDADDDEDRIASDKLQRSKTSDSMAARPLSSDPRRLSQMLRRPSGGAGLGRPVMVESEE